MVYKFFNDKTFGSSIEIFQWEIFQTKNYIKSYTNQLLENSRKKVHSFFIDKIWGVDLADMQLTSKF